MDPNIYHAGVVCTLLQNQIYAVISPSLLNRDQNVPGGAFVTAVVVLMLTFTVLVVMFWPVVALGGEVSEEELTSLVALLPTLFSVTQR